MLSQTKQRHRVTFNSNLYTFEDMTHQMSQYVKIRAFFTIIDLVNQLIIVKKVRILPNNVEF